MDCSTQLPKERSAAYKRMVVDTKIGLIPPLAPCVAVKVPCGGKWYSFFVEQRLGWPNYEAIVLDYLNNSSRIASPVH